ncbi:MAG TPA: hypothetical protein DCY80_05755 [Solibacterales bacterium]|nr:hypothetical protein [Bryobacterales bacterium]
MIGRGQWHIAGFPLLPKNPQMAMDRICRGIDIDQMNADAVFLRQTAVQIADALQQAGAQAQFAGHFVRFSIHKSLRGPFVDGVFLNRHVAQASLGVQALEIIELKRSISLHTM